MRFASMALALPLVLALSVRSEAAPISTVIDFNSAPTGVFSSLVVGDFTFTWIGFGEHQEVAAIGPANNALTDSADDVFGAEVVMSRTDGNPFSVTQFDLIDLTNPVGGGLVRVDVGGVSYNSPSTQTVLRNDLVDITGLRIDIVSDTHEYAVDNIHVTYDPTPVPEPTTLGLVGFGTLAMVSGIRRRKRGSTGQ